MKRSGRSLSSCATCHQLAARVNQRCTAIEARMRLRKVNVEMRNSSRSLRLKQAVIASFYEPAPSVRARLGEFTPRDWQRGQFWLDVSGLAIYFLDRLKVLGLEDCIPPLLLNQLRR